MELHIAEIDLEGQRLVRMCGEAGSYGQSKRYQFRTGVLIILLASQRKTYDGCITGVNWVMFASDTLRLFGHVG